MSRELFFFDKKMVSFFFLMFIAYVAMVNLGPTETLDTKFYYSGNEARDLFQRMTVADLHAYRINEYFDILLLTSYTTALFVGLRRVFSSNSRIPLFAFLPGFSDLVETSAILYALHTTGDQIFFDWLGFVTLFKWTTGALAILFLICRSWWKFRKPPPIQT